MENVVKYELLFNQGTITDRTPKDFGGKKRINIRNRHVESRQNPEVYKFFRWNRKNSRYEAKGFPS